MENKAPPGGLEGELQVEVVVQSYPQRTGVAVGSSHTEATPKPFKSQNQLIQQVEPGVAPS